MPATTDYATQTGLIARLIKDVRRLQRQGLNTLRDVDPDGITDGAGLTWDASRRKWVIGGTTGGAGGAAWVYDEFTTVASTYQLTHIPVNLSPHVALNGLVLREGTDYTVNYSTGIVSTSLVVSGDVLMVRYQRAIAGNIWLPWNSSGWRYLEILATDNTGYSSPSFDDSAWSTGQAPFGADNQGGHTKDAWGGFNTNWPLDGRIWIRRHMGALPAGMLNPTVYVRLDNYCDVYWNGHLLGSFSHVPGAEEDYDNPYSVAVPAAYVDSTNVLAIRATDDGPSSGPDASFIDAQVTVSS